MLKEKSQHWMAKEKIFKRKVPALVNLSFGASLLL